MKKKGPKTEAVRFAKQQIYATAKSFDHVCPFRSSCAELH